MRNVVNRLRARRAVPALLVLASLLTLASCGDSKEPAAPVVDPPPPADAFVFTFKPPAGAPAVTSVAVAGTFNGWSATATPMTRLPSGAWRATLNQSAGPHEYKFVINGTWPGDMCHDTQWGSASHQYWVDTAAVGCVPAPGGAGRSEGDRRGERGRQHRGAG